MYGTLVGSGAVSWAWLGGMQRNWVGLASGWDVKVNRWNVMGATCQSAAVNGLDCRCVGEHAGGNWGELVQADRA